MENSSMFLFVLNEDTHAKLISSNVQNLFPSIPSKEAWLLILHLLNKNCSHPFLKYETLNSS